MTESATMTVPEVRLGMGGHYVLTLLSLDGGPMTAQMLQREVLAEAGLDMHATALAYHLKKCEAAGYVERTEKPEYLPKPGVGMVPVYWRITSSGHAMVEALAKQALDLVTRLQRWGCMPNRNEA